MVISGRFSSKALGTQPPQSDHALHMAGSNTHHPTTTEDAFDFKMVICGLKCMAKVVMPLIPFKGQAWHMNGEVSVLDETF